MWVERQQQLTHAVSTSVQLTAHAATNKSERTSISTCSTYVYLCIVCFYSPQAPKHSHSRYPCTRKADASSRADTRKKLYMKHDRHGEQPD